MATRTVAVDESGRRIGHDQTGAKLTNGDVEQILRMREEGLSYRALAITFEISKSHARDIVKGRRRSRTVFRYKQVQV